MLLGRREQSHLNAIVITSTEADLVPASIDILGVEMELAAARTSGQWQATDLDGTALATARQALNRVTSVATPETPGVRTTASDSSQPRSPASSTTAT